VKARIKEVLLAIKSDPVPYKRFDVVKLRGYANVYRIRIGDIRIVYEVDWEERRIILHICWI
jgi:mRNA interferase RelE/StbE